MYENRDFFRPDQPWLDLRIENCTHAKSQRRCVGTTQGATAPPPSGAQCMRTLELDRRLQSEVKRRAEQDSDSQFRILPHSEKNLRKRAGNSNRTGAPSAGAETIQILRPGPRSYPVASSCSQFHANSATRSNDEGPDIVSDDPNAQLNV